MERATHERHPSHVVGTLTPTATERANVSAVCRHLALVAIDGATDEVADTLAADFRLHVDGVDTDRWGYLSLIEANHAAHGTRPPLDVVTAHGAGHFVTTLLEPRCIAYFRVAGGAIAGAWITTDWHVWRDWLLRHTAT